LVKALSWYYTNLDILIVIQVTVVRTTPQHILAGFVQYLRTPDQVMENIQAADTITGSALAHIVDFDDFH